MAKKKPTAKVFYLGHINYVVYDTDKPLNGGSRQCDIALFDISMENKTYFKDSLTSWSAAGHNIMTLEEFKKKYTIPPMKEWNLKYYE